MARLPTLDDLGPRPTPTPTPAVAVARTGFEAQAIQEMGAAIEQISTKLAESRRASQLTDALGKAAAELEEKTIAYQRDQDFKTAPARFKKDAEVIGQTWAKSIDDPAVREMFGRQYQTRALAKHLQVLQGTAKQEQDYNVASLDERESVYVRSAVEAPEGVGREAVLNELRADLQLMRKSGWITDVDAGRRERSVLGKIDQAIVTRDAAADPVSTAGRLANDPAYAPHLPPDVRERIADGTMRRAESERARQEREEEKRRRLLGDERLKEAFDLDAQGKLTRGHVESIRADVSPAEYKSLLKALEGDGEVKDDPKAFAELQALVYDDPREAERRAFKYHAGKQIKNDTLAAILNRARGVDRQEGPRSPYERERQYVTQVLKPSDFVPDPAASARYAIAIREFDDFAVGGKRTDAELRDKANDIVKRRSITNMVDLAKSTSMEVTADPAKQLESASAKTTQLKAELEAKRITPQKYNQEMAKVNKVIKAAQAAQEANGRK